MLSFDKWQEKEYANVRYNWEKASLYSAGSCLSLEEELSRQYTIYQHMEGISEVVGLHVFPAGVMPLQKKKNSKSSFFGPRQRAKKKEDIKCIQTTMIYTLLTGDEK